MMMLMVLAVTVVEYLLLIFNNTKTWVIAALHAEAETRQHRIPEDEEEQEVML